ncbi:porin [Paraburkholderia aspalathi]|uniref:Outer membrane protein (Porin) n=1 Tax=Paraburkholderia aspalathi TaxID=1324617 RepID=A0A1I7ERM2_9BURK|nr:porin [Paraburkholderia aspalathi]SFU26571.1 Outer membrane protein (porin) [Paraburkholderia aspalathi]
METRKMIAPLCCTALGMLSSTVHAQSSVTLYGLIDEGIVYQSNTGGANGGKRIFLDSTSGLTGSRWGLKGDEDLGSGLHAIFTLESGVNLNSGALAQGGDLFGRQIFVGLKSDQAGSLTFGRQYDMVFYFIAFLRNSGAIGTSLFAPPGDLANTADSVRVNNAIRYMSPTYRGFSYGAEYSVGGAPGNTTANSGYSLGAKYEGGPLSIGAAFQYFKNPTSSTAGSGLFTDNPNGASQLANSLNKGYASASAYQVAIVRATYAIGPVSLVTSFANIQYANLGGALAGGTARFNDFDSGATYTYSPFLFFTVGYDYLTSKGVTGANGQTVGNQHYHQISLLADQFLSKRTDIYVEAAWQHASGTSSTGAPAVADVVNLGDSSNNHQFVVRAVLRHAF